MNRNMNTDINKSMIYISICRHMCVCMHACLHFCMYSRCCIGPGAPRSGLAWIGVGVAEVVIPWGEETSESCTDEVPLRAHSSDSRPYVVACCMRVLRGRVFRTRVSNLCPKIVLTAPVQGHQDLPIAEPASVRGCQIGRAMPRFQALVRAG